MAKKAKPDKQQIASDFLAGVLRLLPEGEARTQAQASLELIGSTEEAANHVADHILSRQDYSRSQDELRTTLDEGKAALATKEQTLAEATESMNAERTRSWTWYKANEDAHKDPAVKAALDAYAVKKDGKPAPASSNGDQSPVDLSGYITKEAHEQTLQQLAGEAVGAMSAMTVVAERHKDDFGERLTTAELNALAAHEQASTLGLEGVHAVVYKEKYETRAKEASEKHDEEILEKGRLAGIAEVTKSAGPGYPIVGETASLADAFEITTEKQVELDAASDPATLAVEYQQKLAQADPAELV